MADLTLVSGAGSEQGLSIVPQQFNWKCKEKYEMMNVFVLVNIFQYSMFLHEERSVTLNTYYFLV